MNTNGHQPAAGIKRGASLYSFQGEYFLRKMTLEDCIEKMGGNAIDVAWSEQCRHNVYTNPKRLTEYVPSIFHIHAKFYEMVDEHTEYSIPYDRIVAALKAGNYQGYLSSEYEGNRHVQDAFLVDSVEQVRRQHAMFERLIAGGT